MFAFRRIAVLGLLCFSSLLLACEPEPPEGTGGGKYPVVEAPDGRSCGRAIGVAMTDYSSSNIALISLSGSTLSGSFLSSASADPGLSTALSGDVVFPSERSEGPLVVLDRYPTSVATLADLETAEVSQQLPVGQGFAANPHDYLLVEAGTAFITRYGGNPTPGEQPFDAGNDIVVVDVETGEIIESIDLSAAVPAGYLPRASRMRRWGDYVLVTLSAYDVAFSDAEEAHLGVINIASRELVASHPIRGLKNCAGIALSPSADEVALSCAGLVDRASEAGPDFAGIVRLQIEGDPEPRFTEIARLEAAVEQLGPSTGSLDYASADLLLTGRYGALEGEDADRPDRIVAWNLVSGVAETVLESEKEPFSLGTILCAEPCGVCFVADAQRKLVHRFELGSGAGLQRTEHVIDESIGLPPRYLGWL